MRRGDMCGLFVKIKRGIKGTGKRGAQKCGEYFSKIVKYIKFQKTILAARCAPSSSSSGALLPSLTWPGWVYAIDHVDHAAYVPVAVAPVLTNQFVLVVDLGGAPRPAGPTLPSV